MIKSKKQMFIVIGVFTLVMMLGTVTFAFFNYTRTGAINNLGTGRIYFSSEQNGSLELTNIFPVKSEDVNPNTLNSVTVGIEGDTTYADGEEYKITLVDVNNTFNNKKIPINYIATYEETTGNSIGEESDTYWESRNSKDASIYTINTTGSVEEGEQVLVGYIDNGDTGINGILTIKAYIDADRIAITDTYPEEVVRTVKTTGYSLSNCETVLTGVTNASTYCASATSLQEAIDNEDLTSEQITLLVNAGIVEEYTNGTTSNWVNGRTVFTTTEWNSFQNSQTPISFKIRAESNEGIWVEEFRTINVMNRFPAIITDEKSKVKEVYFNKMESTAMQNSYNSASIKADLTYNDEGKVLAWLEENSSDNSMYNLIVASDGDTYLTTGALLLKEFANMEKIEFNNINTSRVTNMNEMFYGCSNLQSININKLDTSNVTSMISMFQNCSSIQNLDISIFDTSNVTDMKCMFVGCTSLNSINLNGKGSDVLTSIEAMFSGCTNLTEIYMNNFNFGLILSLQGPASPFYNLANVETIYLNNAISNNIRNMSSTFSGCSSLENLYINNFNTSSVTTMGYLFNGCSNLINLNLSSFDMSNVTNIDSIFRGCTSLEIVDLSGVSTINGNIYNMFADLTSLNTIYVSDKWNMTSQPNGMPIFGGNTNLIGTAPNGTTYSFDSSKVDKTMAVIATNNTSGYLTDVSLKPSN